MQQSLNENQHLHSYYFDSHSVRASHAKRLANFLIDLSFFWGVIYVTGILTILQAGDSPDNLEISSGLDILDIIILIILYVIFIFIQEAFLKGKTLGKFITSTRAVSVDDKKMSLSIILKRSLIRAIPFCFLSGLGSPCDPWQDKWTDTKVIDEKKSTDKN